MKANYLNIGTSVKGGRKNYLAPTCLVVELDLPNDVMQTVVTQSAHTEDQKNDGEEEWASAFHSNIWEDENDFDGTL